ncbi:uncharacterized protein LOC122265044 [Penaeus japonicus]|uniref:uncharacterized protein LOC122265044 n=1 Tax=Penaeus japonicus TaxID=27405 RepID=UPI001C7160CE|nr:uncharacterized protein LOC122265044 [Penaeus japonicus]
MTNCLGEEQYYGWSKEVFRAAKECYGEEINLPEADEEEAAEEEEDTSPLAGWNRFNQQPVYLYYPSQAQGQRFPFNFPYQVISQRQKREALYSAPILKKMAYKVKAKVSNFTCVMKKLNYMDDDFNIDYEKSAEALKQLDINENLKEDLLMGMDKCKELTTCLPLEKFGSPMPVKLQRAIALNKCWKKARLSVCMKQDLMKYLSEFDLSAFPAMEDADEESKAEKLMLILWGVEAKDDFQLY